MKIFKYQQWHALLLTLLLFCIYLIVLNDPQIKTGEYLNIETQTWLIVALLSPIIHQIYVLVCWRSELYNQSISRRFGRETGFKIFKFFFAILILSRPLSLIILAISNSNSLQLNENLIILLTVALSITGLYLFYSVIKYFGMNRAFGLDHFNPAAFKNTALIKKGIFRLSNNAMYVFGFLILYIPAVLWESKAALLIAVFNHLYIWVHYHFTEKPDMKFIYGEH